MEKYSFSNPITNNSALNLGRFYSLVYKKHIDSYGQIGADNIVDNVIDMYKRLLNQFESDTKNNNSLLVGKVQSGKTSNLEMLAAIAFDNGYNLLVIYGGYDNSLLEQTVKRFKNTFDGNDSVTLENDSPAIFTTANENDLSSLDQSKIDILLEYNKPIIIVSMKRPAAMKKVNAFIKKINVDTFKPLVIDDEGDQASLNTAKNKVQDASATYNEIKILKKALNNPLYLSVTATPEANIFLTT